MMLNENCEIIESYGTIAIRNTKDGSQSLELRLVKWYGGPATLDLRWWTGVTAGKGVTFSAKAANTLYETLGKMGEANGQHDREN